jgi:hypothetical protein
LRRTAKGTFDPNDIEQVDLNFIATCIENYLIELEHHMIIPDNVTKESGDQINEGIKVAKKFIKKIRNGNKNVFKHKDEWNYL